MVTELRKAKRPLTRRIGGLVVEILEEGVRLRGDRKKLALFVSWREIALLGLKKCDFNLSEEEWARPLDSLRKLSKLKWK